MIVPYYLLNFTSLIIMTMNNTFQSTNNTIKLLFYKTRTCLSLFNKQSTQSSVEVLQPSSCLSQPSSCLSQPLSCLSQPSSCLSQPSSCLSQPSSCLCQFNAYSRSSFIQCSFSSSWLLYFNVRVCYSLFWFRQSFIRWWSLCLWFYGSLSCYWSSSTCLQYSSSCSTISFSYPNRTRGSPRLLNKCWQCGISCFVRCCNTHLSPIEADLF